MHLVFVTLYANLVDELLFGSNKQNRLNRLSGFDYRIETNPIEIATFLQGL